MRVVRLRDAADIAVGVFNSVRMAFGLGNVAIDGTPALAADADPASGTAYTAAACPGATLSGSWTEFGGTDSYSIGAFGGNPFGLTVIGGAQPWQAGGVHYYQTSTPGQTWTLVTTAYRVDLTWVTVALGAIAHVTVDGQPVKGWDTSQAGPQPFTIQLDGLSHTIVVTNVGDATISQSMQGAITDTTGTGLAACVGLARNGQATEDVTWTFQATSSSAINVKNGGTLIGSLSVGSTSDILIPGFTLSLKAGTWTSTNVASVSTLAASLTLGGVTLYTALSAGGSYTGPILDSGRPDTEWPLLEYTAGPIGQNTVTLSRGAGQTPTPDASWTWQTPTLATWDDPAGGNFQRVACSTLGLYGRYCQTVANFLGSRLEWVSDISVFYWQPTTDPFRRRLNPTVYFGPQNTVPFVTTLAAVEALQYQESLDFAGGFAVLTATGSYLTALGTQFNTNRMAGEAQDAYRQRVLLAQKGLLVGGSQTWITEVLSGALGCPVAVSPLPRSEVGGITFPTTFPATFGQQATGYWLWTVTVPFSQLQAAPEVVSALVAQVRPIGSLAAILYQ